MMEKRKFDEIIKEMESMIVDQRKIVTYKCLIRHFEVKPNTAKQLLYSFASTCGRAHDELSCAYQISGRKQDGSFHTTVINEKDLDDARNSYLEMFSETVYSIQPSKQLDDLQILYTVDKFEDTCKMDCQVITCTECVPQPDREFVNKPVVKPKQELAKKPESVKTKEDEKQPEKKKEEKVDGKKTNSISSMFAAQNQKPKVEKTVKQVEEKEKPAKKAEKSKAKRKTKAKVEDEPKEKRKRIRVFSSSEDEVTEEKERSPSPVPVHEPVVEIEESEEAHEVHKRKKRKIVDKTVMTEEGYIETIKEVVYQTDSDDEKAGPSKVEEKKSPRKVVEKKSPKKSPKVQKKSPVSPKKPKQKPSTDGRKQQSLLSFFKKT